MKHKNTHTDTIILPARQGRKYNCGTMTAIFKADENETNEKYSVSEWWLEPNSGGPGAHQHEDNGEFVRIPAKTIHDFRNLTDTETGVLNFFTPGGFERNMTGYCGVV